MQIITRGLPDGYFETDKQKSRIEPIKYLRALKEDAEYFVIFSSLEGLHKEVFENFRFDSAISAGYIEQEDMICYGESTSLFVSSKKTEDTKIFRDWVKEQRI